ncbi:dihydroflavonol-4-reductase [Dyadobacter soli]|uniref:Dihydroflavonol-4-reductase n=1 Tax=Dyadobacter soli TaxID=659014 RepID=A0A1G7VJ64_9BACT|nr:aldehyde reductase [Dyadobacter soli]SDG59866.1 dihydroflavonol-4-reductase [Dyadobacter soli]
MSEKKVLLTGISGFLGSHTAIKLLDAGYKVTGTLRAIERASAIRAIIGRHTENIGNLELVEADLSNAAIWKELTSQKDYVQHIASPFPRTLPESESELIQTAKSGTLNILQAAAENNVKRVVLTSSVAAVVYGKTRHELNKIFSEDDWSNQDHTSDNTPYFRSKTVAEKAAWNFIASSGSRMELTSVLPGAILGPVLEDDFGTSANMVIKLLDGSSPALPNIGFDIVDVRSVADLLVKAMEAPHAAGERYIASAGYLTFKEIAVILKEHFPNRKVPDKQLPNLLVRLLAHFDASIKPILVDLGVKRKLDISKARRELQWNPGSTPEAVIACAESLIELQIVK